VAKGFGAIEIDQVALREQIREWRKLPERVDKRLRTEFRKVAQEVRDAARSEAERWRPGGSRARRASTTGTKAGAPKRGAYRWKNIVNAITSGADSDTPYIRYGNDRVPGWAGWEFGSDRYPQFGPRTARLGPGNVGRFVFPTVFREAKKLEPRIQKIIDFYTDTYGG